MGEYLSRCVVYGHASFNLFLNNHNAIADPLRPAGVAVNVMCVQHGMIGKAFGLGKFYRR